MDATHRCVGPAQREPYCRYLITFACRWCEDAGNSLSDGLCPEARKFNMDKPKELYEAELERMNAAMSAENQTLLNDNRQLSALIREYEQTLENVMATFRTRAHEVQQHELSLMRAYESTIIQRETEALEEALIAENARSESLARVGRLLRALLRKLGGEDSYVCEEHTSSEGSSEHSRRSMPTSESSAVAHHNDDSTRVEEGETMETGDEDTQRELEFELEEEEDPERRLAAAEWALERECELARLERENEELRRLLNEVWNSDSAPAATAPYVGGTNAPAAAPDAPRSSADSGGGAIVQDEQTNRPLDSSQPRPPRLLGGPTGTVGPFGTLKKRGSN
ncbi:hypothetical protein A0H81_11079 [Grifola frondosa]|uniref:Uncharacterized protein n=1 Tax=Grifola frondosa TaxID=5627 RepID=A0A1C7LVD6_GRIFR|nr:hypothetical protein A0H81_11079 [Grifola frondosa]